MKKQIINFSIFQTCKIISILVFTLAMLICLPWALYLFIAFNCGECLFLIFMPFIYAAAVFIVYAPILWLYNLLAAYFGGIEFELKDIQ